MTAPLVSIVIPCRNAAPWLAATLESALAQTHAPTEILLVDNASTDHSLTVARQFEPRGVRVLEEPTPGASRARNTGLLAARGDFIQFLDADDLLAPDKIERQLAVLAGKPSHVASCRWARFRTTIADAVFADDDLARDLSPVEFLLLHASRGRMMHPAAWLVPRAIADRAGLWNERLSLNDDGEYFARVILASSGIACTPSTASYYRSGLPGSLSRQRTRAALESLHLAADSLTRYLLQAEASPRVRHALADHWQRLEYETYPDAPDLCRQAATRVRNMGGSALSPEMGRRERMVARLFGWRLARRLRILLRR